MESQIRQLDNLVRDAHYHTTVLGKHLMLLQKLHEEMPYRGLLGRMSECRLTSYFSYAEQEYVDLLDVRENQERLLSEIGLIVEEETGVSRERIIEEDRVSEKESLLTADPGNSAESAVFDFVDMDRQVSRSAVIEKNGPFAELREAFQKKTSWKERLEDVDKVGEEIHKNNMKLIAAYDELRGAYVRQVFNPLDQPRFETVHLLLYTLQDRKKGLEYAIREKASCIEASREAIGDLAETQARYQCRGDKQYFQEFMQLHRGGRANSSRACPDRSELREIAKKYLLKGPLFGRIDWTTLALRDPTIIERISDRFQKMKEYVTNR